MRLLSSILSTPELAQYSDEDYERLVWQAKLRRGDAVWVIPMLAGLLAGAAWIGIGIGLTFGLQKVGSPLAGNALKVWGVGNAFVAIVVAIAAGALIRWLMIIRSIRRIINKTGCPFCEFSLVGLKVTKGWVRCPECGHRVYLHEHKLTPEDLLPDNQKHAPPAGLGAGQLGAYKTPQRAARRG